MYCGDRASLRWYQADRDGRGRCSSPNACGHRHSVLEWWPMSTTILDAAVAVLSAEKEPLSVGEIFERIVARQLFIFDAKDPKGVLRSTLRKHVKNAAGARARQRIRLVGRDSYALASQAAS